MKFFHCTVLKYCGNFAAQLNLLVCNAAHLIKSLDTPGLKYEWKYSINAKLTNPMVF